MSHSPCHLCLGPLHPHVPDQPPAPPPGSSFSPALYPLSQPPLTPQEHSSGGFAVQRGTIDPCGGSRVFGSAPLAECSTWRSVGPRRSGVSWRQKGVVRGPHGVWPEPRAPASEQEHPGDERECERLGRLNEHSVAKIFGTITRNKHRI